MKSKRRIARAKELKKARNIVRNNLSKLRTEYVTVTAQNAYKFVRAFSIFQAERRKLREQRETMRRALNKKLSEIAKAKKLNHGPKEKPEQRPA